MSPTYKSVFYAAETALARFPGLGRRPECARLKPRRLVHPEFYLRCVGPTATTIGGWLRVCAAHLERVRRREFKNRPQRVELK